MTPATQAKATRLLAETRVTPAGTAAVYTVQGDNAEYRVVLHHDFDLCTCPAGQRPAACSHRIAARLLYDALERELDQAYRDRQRAEGTHTCHAECPCHAGGEPLSDFVMTAGDRAYVLLTGFDEDVRDPACS